jgi:hypothetical protein
MQENKKNYVPLLITHLSCGEEKLVLIGTKLDRSTLLGII